MGKDERPNNINQCESCELCHEINADPVDIEKNGAKLLTVRIQVDNVCPGKKVCVACIIYDDNNRILAFRGFTKIVCKEDGCGACGTICRKLVFALPDTVDIDGLDVRVAANYIYPCE
jgi:hypothetical protein